MSWPSSTRRSRRSTRSSLRSGHLSRCPSERCNEPYRRGPLAAFNRCAVREHPQCHMGCTGHVQELLTSSTPRISQSRVKQLEEDLAAKRAQAVLLRERLGSGQESDMVRFVPVMCATEPACGSSSVRSISAEQVSVYNAHGLRARSVTPRRSPLTRRP